MTESSDSPEVQAFMAAFQKLRNLVDDVVEGIVSKARDNEALRKCVTLSSMPNCS
jgi:hypothetical protein